MNLKFNKLKIVIQMNKQHRWKPKNLNLKQIFLMS